MDDIIKLKRFCQEIISKPRPMEDQPSERRDGFLWCRDWEIIEILKYLFLGHDIYMMELPPRRLKNNPLWSKAEIEKKASLLLPLSGHADRIIEQLRVYRNGTASGIS